MTKRAELHYDGNIYELPIISGTEDERAIDISKLRSQSGLITLDRGYKNTGSTTSAITFLNGEEGVLSYRGYSIDELATQTNSTVIRTKIGSVEVSRKIAYVMCGGDLTSSQLVSEEYLFDLERENFMSLLGNQKTLDRIQYMLMNKKPLRN